jgi:hypothetical protein
LYWSVLSEYTNSVARAYFLPLRGVLGAGEGGRSWPSRSRGAGPLLLELSAAIVGFVVEADCGFLRGVARMVVFALRRV